VEHARFPRVRSEREQSGGDGTDELEVLRHAILGRIMAPTDVAAIVLEPIQGEGGYFPAPSTFLAGLREICDEHGILLIADEIQSGMGRTGRWWAMQHAGIEPDIVTVAKALAAGKPIGAFLARESVWTWQPGAHASPVGGNPVCAADGLATLALLEDGLIANAARMGDRLKAGLEQVVSNRTQVRDVRGIGLMIGVEFETHDQAAAVERTAFERGLLVLECGESTLRFCPALVVDAPAVDQAGRPRRGHPARRWRRHERHRRTAPSRTPGSIPQGRSRADPRWRPARGDRPRYRARTAGAPGRRAGSRAPPRPRGTHGSRWLRGRCAAPRPPARGGRNTAAAPQARHRHRE